MVAVNVQNDTVKHRFFVELDGQLALLSYRLSPGKVTFTHAEVPRAFEGHGIASAIGKAALEWAKAENLRVVPACPFMASYVEKHPEYQSLVDSPGA
jgi:hypothetical protein